MFVVRVVDWRTFEIVEMPSDSVGIAVSTGLGVSVLAGILSGVCFIIGYRNRITKKRNRKWHCNVCGEYLRSPDFVLRNGQFVYCFKCNSKVCKVTCSSSESDGSWSCHSCSIKKNSWIDGAFRVVEPFTKALLSRMSLVDDPPSELQEYLDEERNREKEQLRDFIERLVNDIIGENVDDASINKIYDDKNYEKIFEKYHQKLSDILTDLGTSLQISLSHLPLVGESPCSAHTSLKLMILRIIREVNDLPQLRGEGTTNTLEQNNRTYEDLLSTAILNKIISTSQNNLQIETPSSSRTNSVYSQRSSSSRRRRCKKEYFFGEETLDNKWKNIDTDTASVSSLEEWVHSDSSLGSTKYVDKVSLTIKQRIEEVSSSDSDREEDRLGNVDVDYFRSNSAFSNDEPNWFLQKRQFLRGPSSPVPVPMLVPDPTTEAKVLIGDKEVDETSDLSDVPSDFEEEPGQQISLMDVKNHLIETRSLIGGKNPLAELKLARLSDDEVSADSGVKECKDLDEMDSEGLSSGRKPENDFAASICSDSSIAERDTEYTEKYGTLPRTILISREENRPRKNENNEHKEPGLVDNIQTNGIEEESNEENQIGFTGVYSQREKEKWNNAVELKNNPYSKENIERRIKSRNTINSLFGSDYYIRQACLPSGAKKLEVANPNSNIVEEISSTQAVTPSEDLQEDSFSETKINVFESSPESLEKTINNNSLDTISLEQTDQDVILSSEITSDSDISLVNCYDVTQSVVYRKLSTDNNEEVQTAEKYFGFESLEASSNFEEPVSLEQEPPRPIAKPRKLVNSSPSSNEIKMQSVPTEYDSKSVKPGEDTFDSVPFVINKRSDNTLIKRIYSDPSVRSFALSNRNRLPIPVEDTIVKKATPPLLASPEKETTKFPTKKEIKKPEEVPARQNGDIKLRSALKTEIKKEHEEKHGDMDCFYALANTSITITKPDNEEKEIIELKEQKLVSTWLKEFSKSFVNLSNISDESLDQGFVGGMNRKRRVSIELDSWDKDQEFQSVEKSTSVKDLRKKFEQFDAKAKSEKAILYSLTGRSISKQFKERLRDMNEDSPTLSQIHSLSLTNLEVEENTR